VAHVALEQIAGLWMAYERRRTLPMWLTCTLVLRAPGKTTLERRSKRLRQRAKDLGGELRLLRWEQRSGWLAMAPLRRPRRTQRGQPVETGTVARTYPFSVGTLAIEGVGRSAWPPQRWRSRRSLGVAEQRVPSDEPGHA